ncbi:MAG TPA: ATP-binding cassette domain-containing protein [Bryobacteraceae bacterium]
MSGAGEAVPGKPQRKAGIESKRRIRPFSFSGALRLSIAVILITLLIEAGFNALIPLSVRFFIDRILSAANHDPFYLMIGVLAVGAGVAIAAGLLRDFLSARVQSRSLSGLRQTMFERLQRVSMAFHSQSRAADLLDRFSTDFASIENAVAFTIPWGVLPAIESLLSTVLAFVLDWRAGLAVFLLWPWIILAPRTVTARVNRASAACKEEEKRVLGALRENLSAQAIIRAFSLEQMGLAGLRNRNDVLSRSMMRAGLLSAFMERFTGAGILGIQTFLLILNAWLVFEKQMSLGTLVALQMLAVTLSNSLLFIIEYLPSIVLARTAWDRIEEIVNAPQAVGNRSDARFLPPLQTEIVFSHVDFSYDGKNRDVTDIKARIPRGTNVAFVGPSGSGKSTILNLLMRFHDPTAGFIAIDGHDLKSVTQSSLRSRIGIVLQENSVFNVSVRENIRLSKPDASEEALLNATKIAGLHDFISGLPMGYGTLLGEQGARLSGAEMQRLAIARAVLRDPEILLLDEATSALDPADETTINETLRTISRGRTVISATHRLSTVADADHIFMFDGGNIVEQGSHFELLAADGPYANLWRKQAGFTFSADGRHVDVDVQRLKAFPILDNLDEETLAELPPFFATETFQPGREIVRQNDPGDKFYIIARGKVEVWRTEEQSGNTKRVAVLQDGDFFGEITLITGFPRTATVRTMTVCTCISLERGQFNRMMDRFPDLRRELSEVAVQRLRESSKAIGASAFVGL